MGFKAEKEKVDKRKKLVKRIALAVAVALLVAFCVFGAFCPPKTWKYYFGQPELSKRNEGELRVHFLDVGQGDSTLVELPDGKILLVDGGDDLESTSTTIMRYLKALDIDTIDYLVVSHADTDHCGGLDVVAEHTKILNAYLPAVNPAKSGEAFASLYVNLVEQGTALCHAARGMQISENSSYELCFLYPYMGMVQEEQIEINSESADSNTLSSVLWLEYKETSILFTGDAPLETETLLVRDDSLGLLDGFGVDLSDVEILKVAHHGSETATSKEFLEYLQLETAVVSCGKNNMYGHPTKEVVDRIAAAGAKLYRTDENGTVSITVQENGAYLVTVTTQNE